MFIRVISRLENCIYTVVYIVVVCSYGHLDKLIYKIQNNSLRIKIYVLFYSRVPSFQTELLHSYLFNTSKALNVVVSSQIFVSIPISFSTVHSYLTNDCNICHHLIENIDFTLPSWPSSHLPALPLGYKIP